MKNFVFSSPYKAEVFVINILFHKMQGIDIYALITYTQPGRAGCSEA